MGDSSDQVSQSPMPTLDTIQWDRGTWRKTQGSGLRRAQGAAQLGEGDPMASNRVRESPYSNC